MRQMPKRLHASGLPRGDERAIPLLITSPTMTRSLREQRAAYAGSSRRYYADERLPLFMIFQRAHAA